MNTAIPETQVIILAGGLGTRLYPLSVERPKALLPVCNLSLLGRLLVQLEAAGFRQAVLTLPAAPPTVHERARAAAPPGFSLVIVSATGPFRGQVPAVREELAPGAEAVLVIYGDSLVSLDFGGLLRAHVNNRAKGGKATIVHHRPEDLRVAEKDGRTYHGVMSVNEQGLVTRFVEKPRVEEISPGFDVANAAVFVCERALLEHPAFRGASDFSYHVFELAAKTHNVPLYGFDVGAGFRYDLGSVERFFDANLKLLRGELPGPLPGEERQPGVWAGEGTTYEGVHITSPVLLGKGVRLGRGTRVGPDAVIGDRCEVGDGATLRRAVLLENCRVGGGLCLDTCVLGPSVLLAKDVRLPPYTVLGAYAVAGADNWPNWAESQK